MARLVYVSLGEEQGVASGDGGHPEEGRLAGHRISAGKRRSARKVLDLMNGIPGLDPSTRTTWCMAGNSGPTRSDT